MSKIVRIIILVLVLLGASYFAFAKFTNLLPSNLNPFKSETIVTDTPVLIEKIKEIGELVGAEFYGEVYADIFTAYNDLIDEHGEDIDKLYDKYSYLKDYAKKNKKINELTLEINSLNLRLNNLDSMIKISDSSKKIQKVYLDSLQIILKDSPKGKRNSDERERYDYVENEFLSMKKLLETSTLQLYNSEKEHKKLAKQLKSSQKDFNSEDKSLTDFVRKRNLVYIGRGHITAGYDISNLKINDIDTTQEKSLFFYLPEVQIIDTVINPWYFKTEKDSLMGYEIYINKKDKYYTNEDVMLIKQKCRKNLTVSALDKGILNLAEKNGKNALESFFLLLGYNKVEIKDKVFVSEIQKIESENE